MIFSGNRVHASAAQRDWPIVVIVERPHIGDDFQHLVLLHAATRERLHRPLAPP